MEPANTPAGNQIPALGQHRGGLYVTRSCFTSPRWLPLVRRLCLLAVILAAFGLTPAAAQSASHFAAIGDYGLAGQTEADVSALVHGWNPDFIITVGDNNYPTGQASTMDANVGQYYQDFIYPYKG